MFGFISEKFSSLFSSSLSAKSIAQALDTVKTTLIEADVPYEVVERFTAQLAADLPEKKLSSSLKPAELVMKTVHDRIVELLGGKSGVSGFSFTIPSVTVLAGLQGSGKTTTIAKLVKIIQKDAAKRNKKRKILVCSVDFYRPAAREQLAILRSGGTG